MYTYRELVYNSLDNFFIILRLIGPLFVWGRCINSLNGKQLEAVRKLMNTFKVDGLTRALTRQLYIPHVLCFSLGYIYTVFDEESDVQVKIAQFHRPEVENRGSRFLIVAFLIVFLRRRF